MNIQISLELNNSLDVGDTIYCLRYDKLECYKIVGIDFGVSFDGKSCKLDERFGKPDFQYLAINDAGGVVHIWNSAIDSVYFRTKDDLINYLETTTKWKLK